MSDRIAVPRRLKKTSRSQKALRSTKKNAKVARKNHGMIKYAGEIIRYIKTSNPQQREAITGPIGNLYRAVLYLRWEWVKGLTVKTTHGLTMDLITAPVAKIAHEVREGLRHVLMMRIPTTRNDLGELPKALSGGEVVDTEATTALHRSRAINKQQKTFLTNILTGGLYTQQRMARANISTQPTATCRFCGAANEDAQHTTPVPVLA